MDKEQLFIVSKVLESHGTKSVFLSFMVGKHYTNDRVSKSSIIDGWKPSVGDVVAAHASGTTGRYGNETRWWILTRAVARVKTLIIPEAIAGFGRPCEDGYIDVSHEARKAQPNEEWRCVVNRISKDGRLVWFPEKRIERVDIHLANIDVDKSVSESGIEKLWVVRRVSGHVVIAHNLAHIVPDVSEKIIQVAGVPVLRRTYNFPFWKMTGFDNMGSVLATEVEELVLTDEEESYGPDTVDVDIDRRLGDLGYYLVELDSTEIPVSYDRAMA